MVDLDSYRSNAAEAPRMRKWFFMALLFSLGMHAGLITLFRATELRRFTPVRERLVPRVFHTSQAQIDPTLLEEAEADQPVPRTVEPPKKITLPADQAAFEQQLEEVRLVPGVPEIAKPILSDKPRVEVPKMQDTARLADKTATEIERELGAVSERLLEDAPPVPKRPVVKAGDLAQTGRAGAAADTRLAASGAGDVAPGFSNLDDLLDTAGGRLKGDEKPIFLPGGALFEFDRYDVRPEAMARLKKLARLIERNPDIHFSIEGHTDAFGTPEYNQWLSEQRALAIRAVLEQLGANPANLATKGFGSSRLIVMPDPQVGTSEEAIQREVERQAPNRRVEIVIRTKR